MNCIYVKSDPTLQLSPIEVFDPSLVLETPQNYQRDADPTKVYGILSPLVSIGGVVIAPEDIMDFRLTCLGNLPTCGLVVRDQMRKLASIKKPDCDTIMRVQIIPPFDGVSKINLELHVSRVKQDGEYMKISGIYRCPELISTRVESFGQLDTYTLFEAIANALKLGFATNCQVTDDYRNMYCSSMNYLQLMEQEIGRAKNEAGQCIYDWWIDNKNYLNFANMYTLLNMKTPNDNMQIYISTQPYTIREETPIEPMLTTALLTNLPSQQNWETFVPHYQTNTDGSSIRNIGTDNVYETYEDSKEGYSDNLMVNSDAHDNLVTNVQYIGESFGDYNSKLTAKVRENFLTKMTADSIKVYLKYPTLSISRGQKVNFAWYVNNPVQDDYESAFQEAGAMNDDEMVPEFDAALAQEYPSSYGKFTLDKAVSGQYLVASQTIGYQNGEWINELILCRPQAENKKRLNI